MSYRDLRNFTEMMRALGYPRLISMQNFQNPNFPLVAEILLWLVQRYDPNVSLPSDTDTEQDRVIFIKSASQFVATKAHIKLNTKRLYMADGYAVRELAKISTVLYNAMLTMNKNGKQDKSSSGDYFSSTFDLDSKLQDLKAVRLLSSQITERGAALYDLLGKEVELRELRQNALAQPLEINEIEKGLRASIKQVESETKKTIKRLDNVASDEVNLEAKINKRKVELERAQKRLKTLENVRPAFMDEFDRLEDELKVQYEQYLYKYRNVTYLEQQLEEFNKQERSRMDANEMSLKKMQDRLREEEKRVILNGDNFLNDEGDDIAVDDDSDGLSDLEDDLLNDNDMNNGSRPKRPTAGMYGGDSDEDETLSSSDISVANDDDEGESEDSDDLLLQDESMHRPAAPTSGGRRQQHALMDDSDDF